MGGIIKLMASHDHDGTAEGPTSGARAIVALAAHLVDRLRTRYYRLDVQLRYTLPATADAALAARRAARLRS